MSVQTYNLGTVTAYADAKAGGYTGTKEEWEALMADYATVGQQAATSAQTANTAKTAAETAATTATTKATEAATSATNAANSADSIAASASQIAQNTSDISDLKEDLNSIEPIFYDYFDTEKHTETTTNIMEWSAQYYDLNTGELKTLTGYSHTEKFPCEAGDVVGIGLNTGQVLFWGANGYLSYVATSPSTGMQITVPTGATEYACNNRDVTYRPTETTVTKSWTEKVLVSAEYGAPAQILYKSDAFVNKNYASTANGALYTGDSYAGWYCAFKVPCKPAHNYRTTIQTQVCFYNSQGTFISAYIPTINGNNISGVEVEMDFTTPDNCAFFSINSNSAHEIVFDLKYIEYGNGKSVYPLLGKTIVCFGDSITGNYYFGDNYPYQIEKETGAKVYDVGFGGCRMELTNETSIQFVNPFSMVSLADAVVSDAPNKWSTQEEGYTSFAARGLVKKRLEILENINFSNVNIITIAYGTNGVGLPLDDPENPLNTYTYAGATRYAIKTLLTKYPHLRIMLMTPIYRWYSATSDDGDTHQLSGQTLLDRVTKLLEVGAEIKIPTIDLYHTLGINKYNYTGYFGDDDETADGTHINSFGREQMGRRVACELIRLF